MDILFRFEAVKNGDEGSLPVAVFVSNLIREIRDRSY